MFARLRATGADLVCAGTVEDARRGAKPRYRGHTATRRMAGGAGKDLENFALSTRDHTGGAIIFVNRSRRSVPRRGGERAVKRPRVDMTGSYA